jgi:hypothetical protein
MIKKMRQLQMQQDKAVAQEAKYRDKIVDTAKQSAAATIT